MRWIVLWLAVAWAQTWEVRALFQAKSDGPIMLRLLSSDGEKVVSTTLRDGKAQIDLPQGFRFSQVVLIAEGHLPLVFSPKAALQGVIDFTDPALLHPQSAYVLVGEKAVLAAGDLGRLPDDPHPVINAYDIELFFQAERTQDKRADFNGDGKVDTADFEILLHNQGKLLQTRL